MIALRPPSVTFSGEDTAKQAAANKQMSDLLQRVAKGQLHRTLTTADRKLLENEGYAPDLINNLVYKTQRFKNGGLSDFTDKLVTGFTDAAIDPSIYASPAVTHALETNNQGKCAFCESHLSATDAGRVFHFRPVAILEQDHVITRSPYYKLAYDINNLHYACSACCESYKQAQFPVNGQRFPAIPVAQEKALLLNPYTDKPNDVIGFSPITGAAYALDVLQDYFEDSQKIAKADVKGYLLMNPKQIPDLFKCPQSTTQADSEVQQSFDSWCNNKEMTEYRGYQSIQLFGLNREALLYRRFHFLGMAYKQFQCESTDNSPIEYQGTYQDAVASWQENAKKDNAQQIDWNSLYGKNPYAVCAKSPKAVMPGWMKSRLCYFVRESELTVTGKRRIVYLGADDLIYGADIPEKSVFLSINWQSDIQNTLKVRNKKLTWETTFTELANSHPLEISKLFANNEIWAEGDYKPLA
ncbi:MAG: hypothetical protein ACFHVJ_08535 [Aestuariibacter sp.]